MTNKVTPARGPSGLSIILGIGIVFARHPKVAHNLEGHEVHRGMVREPVRYRRNTSLSSGVCRKLDPVKDFIERILKEDQHALEVANQCTLPAAAPSRFVNFTAGASTTWRLDRVALS